MSVISTVSTALGWRYRMLTQKSMGRMSTIPWPLLLAEVTQRRDYTFTLPEMRLLEEDADAGLTLLKVGDYQYWVPRELTPHSLEGIYKEIYFAPHPHHYEFQGCRIRPGDVVLDCGALEGFFARFALDRGASVLLVEPWSRAIEGLKRTFAPEIASGRVQVVRAALSDTCGTTHLSMFPDFPLTNNVCMGDDSLPKEEVPTITIDELVRQSRWGYCDFIKMDIEGVERPVVRGAAETIQRDRPTFSIAVYHLPPGYVEIAGDLRSAQVGYQVTGRGVEYGLDKEWRVATLYAWAPEGSRPKR